MADTMTQTIPESVNTALDQMVQSFAYGARSPLLRRPSDVGLAYNDIHFPSSDGTLLEAWYIPCPSSTKLIICTHPFKCSRAGFPSHIEPWKSTFGPGNDFELNFVLDYKVLHDAGYNVLCYDFRNHGHSASANGGINSGARFEARDVLGSMAYVRSRPDLKDMKLGLFSRCMGGNATFRAFQMDPAAFEGVRCMVSPLLLSTGVAVGRGLEAAGLGEYVDVAEHKLEAITSGRFADGTPKAWAPSVYVPTLTYGVHDDPVTTPADLEGIFEVIGAKEKEMFWIEGTTRRWDGYMYFQRHPDRILAWFDKYMK